MSNENNDKHNVDLLKRILDNVLEEPEPIKATIKGSIPKWLKGTLLYNGPGMFKIGPDQYKHWFDGLAFLQRFHIQNGEVLCSTRYLRSETFQRNTAANRIVVSEFGTLKHPDPCKSLFKRYFSYFFDDDSTDNNVDDFYECGDGVYASFDATKFNFINPVDLETIRQEDISHVIAINSMTSHAHTDIQGDLYNMGSSSTDYCLIKTPNPKTTGKEGFVGSEIIAKFPISKPGFQSYYHSFGMSENYAVQPEMCLVINEKKLSSVKEVVLEKPPSDAMEWRQKMKPVFNVCNRHTGEVPSIKYAASEPFFTFHHINAFEHEGCLYVDLVKYQSGGIVKDLKTSKYGDWITQMAMEGENAPMPSRFILPLEIPENAEAGNDVLDLMGMETSAKAILQSDGTLECSDLQLSDVSLEMPQINYNAVNQKNYKFFYGTGASKDGLYGSKVYKCNTVSKSSKCFQLDAPHEFASEPVFVAKPGAKREDDGVVLVPISDVRESAKDYLLMLDATKWTELARAIVEPRLTLSFHGHYFKN